MIWTLCFECIGCKCAIVGVICTNDDTFLDCKPFKCTFACNSVSSCSWELRKIKDLAAGMINKKSATSVAMPFPTVTFLHMERDNGRQKCIGWVAYVLVSIHVLFDRSTVWWTSKYGWGPSEQVVSKTAGEISHKYMRCIWDHLCHMLDSGRGMEGKACCGKVQVMYHSHQAIDDYAWVVVSNWWRHATASWWCQSKTSFCADVKLQLVEERSVG